MRTLILAATAAVALLAGGVSQAQVAGALNAGTGVGGALNAGAGLNGRLDSATPAPPPTAQPRVGTRIGPYEPPAPSVPPAAGAAVSVDSTTSATVDDKEKDGTPKSLPPETRIGADGKTISGSGVGSSVTEPRATVGAGGSMNGSTSVTTR